MIRPPPSSTPLYSSAASDVYKRQVQDRERLRHAGKLLERAGGALNLLAGENEAAALDAVRLADQALGDADGIERRGLVLAGQEVERASGALQQPAGVTQPLAVLHESLVLPASHLGRLDLADLEAQHIDLAFALPAGATQLLKPARQRPGLLESRGVCLLERGQLGRRRAVQQVQLALELEQMGVLEPPVEGEPRAERLFHGRRRAQETVHVRPRAAAARELPRHREGVAVALEERLHQGAGGAGAHQLVAALLAHEQADRLGEQSLAGAGLAGDDVEARRELEARGGDEDQIVDRELSEHRGGRRASPRRSGRRTLRRSP